MRKLARLERDYLWHHRQKISCALILQFTIVMFNGGALDGGRSLQICVWYILAYWSAVGLARVCLGPRFTLSAGLLVAWGGVIAGLLGTLLPSALR